MAEQPEVENGGGQENGCAALRHRPVEILELPRPAGSHHRQLHHVGDGAGERKVVPGFRAVAVHACGEDDPCAQFLAPAGPGDGVLARGLRAARHHDFESRGHGVVSAAVDGDGDLLLPELLRRLPHEVWGTYRRAVHRNLVGPGLEHHLDVLQASDPASDGQGDVDHGRDGLDPGKTRLPVLQRCGDVQHGQLVRPFLLVERGIADRVSRFLQVHEMDSLDHPAVFHVETGHDSNRFHVVHTSF